MNLSINLIPKNNSFQLEIGNIDEKPTESQKLSKLTKKLDLKLIPILAIIYLFSFLDRINIGYAKIYQIEEDLNLTPIQFSWSLSIFFIGYVIFEVPSNLLLKKVTPSIWLARIMLTWGSITIASAFVTNWAELMSCRFFLGVAEAGLFPGIIYYLSFWYTREEQGLRIALFYSASCLAGTFSGLLAYGVNYIDNLGGLACWKWIFIIEGIPSIIIGISIFWLLPNTPDKANWLTNSEKEIIINRLIKDNTNPKTSKFYKSQFWEALTDYKVYIYMIILFGITLPIYSMAQLLPSIINLMGFDKLNSLLLTAPPYTVSIFTILALSYNSDKKHERCIHIIIPLTLGITGFLIMTVFTDKFIKYSGAFFAVIGMTNCIPITLAWLNNNMLGSTKSGTASAMAVSFGNIGGVIAGQLYRFSEAPGFIRSNSIILVFSVISLCFVILLRYCLILENFKLDQLRADEDFKWDREDGLDIRKFNYIL